MRAIWNLPEGHHQDHEENQEDPYRGRDRTQEDIKRFPPIQFGCVFEFIEWHLTKGPLGGSGEVRDHILSASAMMQSLTSILKKYKTMTALTGGPSGPEGPGSPGRPSAPCKQRGIGISSSSWSQLFKLTNKVHCFNIKSNIIVPKSAEYICLFYLQHHQCLWQKME